MGSRFLCSIRDKRATELAVELPPMKRSVEHIARSLIALHGVDALKVAEQSAAEARKLGTADLEAWLGVIAEIKRIQTPA